MRVSTDGKNFFLLKIYLLFVSGPLTSDLVAQIIGDGKLSDFDESDLENQFFQYDKEGGDLPF